jgi:DNA-binding SARP family transcriptional activator
MAPPLSIQMFGSLHVTVRGEPMPRVRTRSVEWLLALLVLHHGRAVSRSWLAGTLWPESSGSKALENLRADLVRLRKALGPESGRLQAPARDSLTLDLAGAAVDVLQFDAAMAAGDEEALRCAVTVYTGPLLEGCVEEWAFSERAARAEQLMAALEALAERAAARDDHSEAIRYLRRAEVLDPLRDTLPRRLMTSLAAAGDPAAAIQTYRDFRLRLQEELAAAPDQATTRLFHEIRAAARTATRASDPAPGRRCSSLRDAGRSAAGGRPRGIPAHHGRGPCRAGRSGVRGSVGRGAGHVARSGDRACARDPVTGTAECRKGDADCLDRARLLGIVEALPFHLCHRCFPPDVLENERENARADQCPGPEQIKVEPGGTQNGQTDLFVDQQRYHRHHQEHRQRVQRHGQQRHKRLSWAASAGYHPQMLGMALRVHRGHVHCRHVVHPML